SVDDPAVMAGQGTAALELVEDAGPLDLLLARVGEGGLVAGSATAARGLDQATRVLGVEPETGDDHRRSLESGRRVMLPHIPATIADGLQAPTPGALPFEINRTLLEGVVTVDDDETVRAMVVARERLKVVLEPSGAVALAAVLCGNAPGARGRRAGVIRGGGAATPVRLTA